MGIFPWRLIPQASTLFRPDRFARDSALSASLISWAPSFCTSTSAMPRTAW